MKTMIITVPLGDELDLVPYDLLDLHRGTVYENEDHFRQQDWVKLLENVQVYELPNFIECCNDDDFDPSDFWLGYMFFKKFQIKLAEEFE
jgi:hypothetical protein